MTHDRQTIRMAIKKARMINAMLQGTMGLEGQGLDARFMHQMRNETARELLARWDEIAASTTTETTNDDPNA